MWSQTLEGNRKSRSRPAPEPRLQPTTAGVGVQPQDAAAPLPAWAKAYDAATAQVKIPPHGRRAAAPQTKVQATARLSCDLDMEQLCQGFVNCELGRRSTAPLVIHMREPRSSVKVFADGRMDFVGTCSVEEARQVLKRVARRCWHIGFTKVRFKAFQIRQVSWSQPYDLRSQVNLLQLAHRPGVESYLDAARPRVRVPCQSPSRVARSDHSPCVEANVFASGKVWFCGAQSEEELWRALVHVLPVLEACRCERLDGPGAEAIS